MILCILCLTLYVEDEQFEQLASKARLSLAPGSQVIRQHCMPVRGITHSLLSPPSRSHQMHTVEVLNGMVNKTRLGNLTLLNSAASRASRSR